MLVLCLLTDSKGLWHLLPLHEETMGLHSLHCAQFWNVPSLEASKGCTICLQLSQSTDIESGLCMINQDLLPGTGKGLISDEAYYPQYKSPKTSRILASDSLLLLQSAVSAGWTMTCQSPWHSRAHGPSPGSQNTKWSAWLCRSPDCRNHLALGCGHLHSWLPQTSLPLKGELWKPRTQKAHSLLLNDISSHLTKGCDMLPMAANRLWALKSSWCDLINM